MKLLIVESPGKIKKLGAILGDGWRVAASVGHIRDLPEKGLGIDSRSMAPRYVLTERGQSVAAKLEKLVKSTDAGEVYLATDPDREGEAIAWHLQEVLHLANPKRCTFQEISAEPVRTAVANPRKIDDALVRAQEARRVLDRLVGYVVSPRLSAQAGTRMPAGRVQSPAVRLVVERERAIAAFKVQQHYGVGFTFDSGWTAEWDIKATYPEAPHFCLNRNAASTVAALRTFTVEAFKDSERRRQPSAPFTTSTLQQVASSQLTLKPKQTMELAQALYEQGAISYHRTDTPNLSVNSFQELQRYGARARLPIIAERRVWKAKEGAQEAHEAIRPTHFEDETAGTNEDERRLYALIRRRAVASQLPEAVYAVRSAVLAAVIGVQRVCVLAKGETLTAPGWTQFHSGDDEDEDAASSNPIPALTVGQAVTAAESSILDKKTKAPARYTEGTLVKGLEARGIGRPSTYAAIMDKIVSAGYVSVQNNLLHATALADQLVDALVGTMQFIEIDFTSKMENDLDAIACGNGGYTALVSATRDQINTEIERLHQGLAASAHACPECRQSLRRVKGAKGYFWGCTGYPECKATLPDHKGKPGTSMTATVSAHPCPVCGTTLVHRVKPGSAKTGFDFWGCSAWPSCKFTAKNDRGKPAVVKGSP